MIPPGIAALLNFMLRILYKGGAYIVLLILANLYSPETFGAAATAIAGFTFLQSIIYVGLPRGIVPFLVKDNVGPRLMFFLFALTAFSVGIGILLSSTWPIILPLALALPFTLFHRFAMAVVQSKHQHHLEQLITLGFVVIPIGFFFALRGNNPLNIVWSYVIGYVVTSLIAIWIVRKDIFHALSRRKETTVVSYLQNGVPVAFVAAAFGLMGQLDAPLLRFFTSNEVVAQYSVVSPIAWALSMIPFSVGMFLLTRAAETKTKDAENILHQCMRLCISCTVLGATALAIIVPFLVTFFFPQYPGVQTAVVVLTAASIFHAAHYTMYTYLIARFKSLVGVVPVLLAAGVNILLDIVLIPKFGLFGIIFATIITHLFAFVVFALLFRSFLRYVPLVVLAGLPVLAHYLGAWGVLVLLLCGGLLWVSRILTLNDVVVMRNTIYTTAQKMKTFKKQTS